MISMMAWMPLSLARTVHSAAHTEAPSPVMTHPSVPTLHVNPSVTESSDPSTRPVHSGADPIEPLHSAALLAVRSGGRLVTPLW